MTLRIDGVGITFADNVRQETAPNVATENSYGMVKLATEQDIQSGDNPTSVVTSKQLNEHLDVTVSGLPQASETKPGIIKLATAVEARTGTDAFKSITSKTLKSVIISSASLVHTFGDETIDGIKTFQQIIKGTAMTAKWADIAELYVADNEYKPGTLIAFGGEKDITIATDNVNGIISTKPGFVLNSTETGLPVAFVGKVPVLVKGIVHRFDNIVLSDEPGIGIVDNTTDQPIAKALEENTDEHTKLVLSVTMLSLK